MKVITDPLQDPRIGSRALYLPENVIVVIEYIFSYEEEGQDDVLQVTYVEGPFGPFTNGVHQFLFD